MSLDLDTRQRAMLQEMGVHVWLPPTEMEAPEVLNPPMAEAAAATAPRSVPQVPRAAEPVMDAVAIEAIAISAVNTRATAPKTSRIQAVAVATGTPAVLADGIAAMDWAALTDTVTNCQACKLCTGRQTAVFAGAQDDVPRRADWLVVGEPPDDAEERQGVPLVEAAGLLLDNMLKAVGVKRTGAALAPEAAAYVTNAVKCRPAVVRNPTPAELALCENFLRREVALVQPKVILAMGRFAAQILLQASQPDVAAIPLGKLRGQVYRYQGIPVIVTYPTSYLLRTPQDKARAWADLCLALAVLQGPQA